MLYKVYVLYSPGHKKLFAGLTSSLSDQMLVHNGDDSEDWTNEFKPWTLIHMEMFSDESEAAVRELFLKSEGGETYIRKDIMPLFEF